MGVCWSHNAFRNYLKLSRTLNSFEEKRNAGNYWNTYKPLWSVFSQTSKMQYLAKFYVWLNSERASALLSWYIKEHFSHSIITKCGQSNLMQFPFSPKGLGFSAGIAKRHEKILESNLSSCYKLFKSVDEWRMGELVCPRML